MTIWRSRRPLSPAQATPANPEYSAYLYCRRRVDNEDNGDEDKDNLDNTEGTLDIQGLFRLQHHRVGCETDCESSCELHYFG